jgi:hypothetical protein
MQKAHLLLFLQLLEPKRLLTQPWSISGQMSASSAISQKLPMQKAHLPLFLQLLEPKRLLTQPLLT